MKNQTVTKADNAAKSTCRIDGCPAELRRMLMAALGNILHFPAEGECDIVITTDADGFLFTDTHSETSVIAERPATPDSLRESVASLSSRHSRIAFSADPETCSAVLGDSAARLTKTEFRLYSAILENDGELISAEELSRTVWGNSNRNLCTVYLSYLRNKLDRAFGNGTLICVRGKGYRLRNFDK